MTKFYTIISFGPEPSARTDTAKYSHRSVCSYRTLAGAKRALEVRGSDPNLEYRYLLTIVHRDGGISSEWVTE